MKDKELVSEGFNYNKHSSGGTGTGSPITPNSYKTTSGLSSFFAFLGWIVVVIGVLATFGLVGSIGPLGFLAGIQIIVMGLMMVVMGQAANAAVRSANNTDKILTKLSELND